MFRYNISPAGGFGCYASSAVLGIYTVFFKFHTCVGVLGSRSCHVGHLDGGQVYTCFIQWRPLVCVFLFFHISMELNPLLSYLVIYGTGPKWDQL